MKNIVSFETAQRLKEAGFPQPKPEMGQFWFDKKGNLCIVVHNKQDWQFRICFFGYLKGRGGYLVEVDFVFAPTATDILYLLQKNTRSPFWWALVPYPHEETWGCIEFERLEDKNIEFENTDPAEAAAAAWLAINEKKQHQ
jgi:hypothetical protein